MAVVREYVTDKAIVRIHDDYLIKDEEEKQRILDRLWALNDRVVARKLQAEGIYS